MSQVVCQKDDLQPGEIMEVTYKEKSIVLCRSKAGDFYAFLNRCLHQGAPLSEGKLCSTSAFTDTHGEYRTVKDGEILRCPWHGIEFDITDGGRESGRASCRERVYMSADAVSILSQSVQKS